MRNESLTEAERNINFTLTRVAERGWRDNPEQVDRFAELRKDARFRDAQVAELYEQYFLPERHEYEWQVLSDIVYAVVQAQAASIAEFGGMAVATGLIGNAAYDVIKHLCNHAASAFLDRLGTRSGERADSFRSIANDAESLKEFFTKNAKARIDDIERETKIPRERIYPIIKLAGLNHNRREDACYWQIPLGQAPSMEVKANVDFAIITVREDEYLSMLKRFPKDDLYRGKHREYVLSHIPLDDGSHYVVAIVRSTEQGEGYGQDVARDVIDDLDPQWLLLVGIAGGVPAAEYTLGDVVAAMRLTDFSVRAVREGKPDQYAVSGGPIHRQVQDRLALLPALKEELGDWNSEASIGMTKPPVQLDPRNFYGDKEWKKKVKESLTRHFGASVSARPPIVTTGAILTSDTLVKDAQTLQQWQEAARQVLAVEMELGGVYIAAQRSNHVYPVLAIRGISDIVGFKRHPGWTEYACHSAAAFAKAFILTRPITPRSAAH